MIIVKIILLHYAPYTLTPDIFCSAKSLQGLQRNLHKWLDVCISFCFPAKGSAGKTAARPQTPVPPVCFCCLYFSWMGVLERKFCYMFTYNDNKVFLNLEYSSYSCFFLSLKVHYAQQGWQYFNGSFYYISSTKQNWQDSRDDCLQRGASLAIINSKEEQVLTSFQCFIPICLCLNKKFIRQQQETIIWIGLTDKETEGVSKWVDETPLTESFWYSGEPNNYRGSDEDCVVINDYNDENSWNDAVCENQNLWLCEKKMVI
uniref:C-type lectin domain-containing protein n=1 Tax=Amphilophus citrinellus TaxID=61819 RepID=A0A3Q0RF76_AMPCI